MPTSTVPLFAPGLNEMIDSIHSMKSELPGKISFSFAPTPVATVTAPDGNPATMWKVAAHEYASYHGYTTHLLEKESFVQASNYFSAKGDDGETVECYFKSIGAKATCVAKEGKHKVTETFKAEPFVTAYVKYTESTSHKKHKATSTSTSTASASATQDEALAQVAVATQAVDDVAADDLSSSSYSSSSSSLTSSAKNMSSGAQRRSSLPRLEVAIVASTLLLSAVLTLQHVA
ncbi:hypothetical protein BCV70DRAFT_218128 [Testicularia cyperi]|uniref:Uncharacterized protein n=1 Tax=Testicularia cyperi TaxID=1882483 RepID=A0A317XLJ1_9BASI|nr:hypothetical protein BCV70DRAFT_218128 [Testicularia cyperi]